MKSIYDAIEFIKSDELYYIIYPKTRQTSLVLQINLKVREGNEHTSKRENRQSQTKVALQQNCCWTVLSLSDSSLLSTVSEWMLSR